MKKAIKKELNSKKSKELLQAALQLFLEKGFENVTVRDIVTEANSSMGNLYFHFSNKLDILRFIGQKYLDVLQQKTQANLDLPYESHINYSIDLRIGLISTLEDPQLYQLFMLVRELPEIRKNSIRNKILRINTFFHDRYSNEEIETIAIAFQGISDAFFRVRGEKDFTPSLKSMSNYIIKYNLLLLGFSDSVVNKTLEFTDQYFDQHDFKVSFNQVIESIV